MASLTKEDNPQIYDDIIYMGSVSIDKPKQRSEIVECMKLFDFSLKEDQQKPLNISLSIPESCQHSIILYEQDTKNEISRFKVSRIMFCARGEEGTSQSCYFAFTCSHGLADSPRHALFKCHVFKCAHENKTAEILLSFARSFRKPSQDFDSSPNDKNASGGKKYLHQILDVTVEIKEESGKDTWNVCPYDANRNMFKFRMNLPKRFDITVTAACTHNNNKKETNSNHSLNTTSTLFTLKPIIADDYDDGNSIEKKSVEIGNGSLYEQRLLGKGLRVERCFGIHVTPGSNFNQSKLHLLDILSMYHNEDDIYQYHLSVLWDPKDFKLDDFLVYTPDGEQAYLVFTLGLDLIFSYIQEPVRLLIHLRARLYPETEKFWYHAFTSRTLGSSTRTNALQERFYIQLIKLNEQSSPNQQLPLPEAKDETMYLNGDKSTQKESQPSFSNALFNEHFKVHSVKSHAQVSGAGLNFGSAMYHNTPDNSNLAMRNYNFTNPTTTNKSSTTNFFSTSERKTSVDSNSTQSGSIFSNISGLQNVLTFNNNSNNNNSNATSNWATALAKKKQSLINQFNTNYNAYYGNKGDVGNKNTNTNMTNGIIVDEFNSNSSSMISGEETVFNNAEEDNDEPLLSGTGGVENNYEIGELELWAQTLAEWRDNPTHRPKRISQMCQKGVPDALRGEVWQFLAQTYDDSEKMELYKELITKDSSYERVIRSDIYRTFPAHQYFKRRFSVSSAHQMARNNSILQEPKPSLEVVLEKPLIFTANETDQPSYDSPSTKNIGTLDNEIGPKFEMFPNSPTLVVLNDTETLPQNTQKDKVDNNNNNDINNNGIAVGSELSLKSSEVINPNLITSCSTTTNTSEFSLLDEESENGSTSIDERLDVSPKHPKNEISINAPNSFADEKGKNNLINSEQNKTIENATLSQSDSMDQTITKQDNASDEIKHTSKENGIDTGNQNTLQMSLQCMDEENSKAIENDRENSGQECLYRLIKAYSVYDTEIGYCQGLSFLAASLLLHMPEEQAFCLLVKIMYGYDLRNLFRQGFQELQIKFYQLERLMQEQMPSLYTHFCEIGIEVHMFASQWFLTIFTAKFPLNVVFHILDVFLCQGALTIFSVSLALLKISQPYLLHMDFEQVLKYFRVNLPKRFRSQKDAQYLLDIASGIKINSKRFKKYEKEYVEMKEREEFENDPIEILKRDNFKLKEANMRLERENDMLAQELVSSKIRLRSDLDATEDTAESLSLELEQMAKALKDSEEDNKRLLIEIHQIKEMYRKELLKFDISPITSEASITLENGPKPD